MSKPSLAIAYSMKRKKKASGGSVKSGDPTMNYSEGGSIAQEEDRHRMKGVHAPAYGYRDSEPGTSIAGHEGKMGKRSKQIEAHYKVLGEMKGDETDRKNLASGGSVSSGDPEMNYAEGGRVLSNKSRQNHETGIHESASDDMDSDKGQSFAGATLRSKRRFSEGYAKSEHEGKLKELKAMPGPTSGKSGFAEGGSVDCPSCGHNFSHGGQVANDTPAIVDGMPNQFDDLVLRDTLEDSHNTGADDGDEDGLVRRAMRRRMGK